MLLQSLDINIFTFLTKKFYKSIWSKIKDDLAKRYIKLKTTVLGNVYKSNTLKIETSKHWECKIT